MKTAVQAVSHFVIRQIHVNIASFYTFFLNNNRAYIRRKEPIMFL